MKAAMPSLTGAIVIHFMQNISQTQDRNCRYNYHIATKLPYIYIRNYVQFLNRKMNIQNLSMSNR